jgi:glyoxylase-like metal-dependent hydrolase (beta-lactamase superfamily II)
MASEPHVLPLHLADVHLPEGERWPAGVPFPVIAHAVVHRDGVFLFDSGIGAGNAEVEELYAPERFPLEGALAAHGIDLADVTAAANCHLHIDHGGQNGLLAGRPIFVQRREWAMVHEPDFTIAEWVDVPGLRYEVLDGEAEVAPGLRVLPTPGHTPGHQSLVIDSDAGRVVIAGQAVLTVAEWEGSDDLRHSGLPEEGEGGREDYVASVARLRALDPVRVHFVHDPATWERGG